MTRSTLSVLFLCLALSARADLWIEIQRGLNPNDIQLRVMDSEFRSDLYWIDRSNDGGRTWSPYRPVINGEWNLVSRIPSDSMFRARFTAL